MKTRLLTFLVALVTATPSFAQLTTPNAAGAAIGHIHINATDVDAQSRFWTTVGVQIVQRDKLTMVQVPGVYILLQKQDPTGGTAGSTLNHFGLYVKDFAAASAKWKAAGLNWEPNKDPKVEQGFLTGPDGVRIEILEDKTQTVPVRNEHVHLSLTAAEVPKAQAWYAKTFGGKAGTRNNQPVVDLPGVQIRFATADSKQAVTRGRVLDHIGFDVRDHAAFVKKLEADGVKLDEPPRTGGGGNTITYITDPWGTRIEIIQRAPLGQQVTSAQ